MGKVKGQAGLPAIKTEEIHKDDAERDTEVSGTESPVATSQQETGEHVRENLEPEKDSGRTDTDVQGSEEDNIGTDGSGEDEVPEDLVATYPILYLSHQYKVGEVLPASDPEMVQAWLDAGTAAWSIRKGQRTKARPATAEPGLPAQTAGLGCDNGDKLVGKIPRTGIGRR